MQNEKKLKNLKKIKKRVLRKIPILTNTLFKEVYKLNYSHL